MSRRGAARARARAAQTVLEASGGVTLDRIREIAKTGVDVISIGAITHSARAIDFSFEIRPVGSRGAGRGDAASDRSSAALARCRSSRSTPSGVARALTTRWLGRPCEWLAVVRVDQRPGGGARRARAPPKGWWSSPTSRPAGAGGSGGAGTRRRARTSTFSILLRPARPPVEIPPLTLLAGAAVARRARGASASRRGSSGRTTSQLGRSDAARKPAAPRRSPASSPRWRARASACGHVVVGIGLNVNGVAFPPELAERATSLRRALGRAVRSRRRAGRRARRRSSRLRRVRGRRPGRGRAMRCRGARRAPGALPRDAPGSASDDLEGVALGVDPDGALRIATRRAHSPRGLRRDST